MHFVESFRRFYDRRSTTLTGSGWLKSIGYREGDACTLGKSGPVPRSAQRFGNTSAKSTPVQNLPKMIWLIDDDDEIRSLIAEMLKRHGYRVTGYESGEQLPQKIATAVEPPSLILLDMRMPRMSGLEVLAEMERQGCRIPVIVLSGVEDVATVVKAMRLGAEDYLPKPPEEFELLEAIERTLGEQMENTGSAPEIMLPSSNGRMLHVRAVCDQVAPADVPILILGESGVGKEVLAKYIHMRSGRRDPFVRVNCAALPADLLESELFGHERGAFTGAQREKPGKFELAGQGTIMLDEIAEMSPLLQAKLLHVLQDGEYFRLGGLKPLRSEARIIAATNKRLSAMVKNNTFREDLYFRLNVITVSVPPLREHPEDILPLCSHFEEKYRAKYNCRVRQLPPELLAAFARYSWPGNVRQLENAVKRFLILPDLRQALAELEEEPKPAAPAPMPPSRSVSLKNLAASAAEKAEKDLVFQTLNEVNWNRKQAARRLNICYKSLLNKLHRWQLNERAARENAQGEEHTAATAGH
jgi:DNA-binding NtrC family response regulator